VISQRSCWQIEKHGGFIEHTLLESILKVQFFQVNEGKGLYIQVFMYFIRACFEEGGYKNERWYFVETRIVITLSQLAT